MTLCIAWIRETSESEELVFATDSALTGGEKWNHGVKLFELPRKDCLLCFAGETYRAYPLILNLISTIKHDEKLQNPRLDVKDVLYGIVDTFTELVNSIFNMPTGDNLQIGSEAKFLFGGWSWQEGRFMLWRLYYSAETKAFLFQEEATRENNLGKIAFLGDPETPEKDISGIANQKYKEELIRKDKFGGMLDMEPLAVLVEMSRNRDVYDVDGALQIGKIYRSGTSEFFGIMWPSVKGAPTFLGKTYGIYNKPRVKYFDPDTCEMIEDEIPKYLINIESFNDFGDYEFLKSCYSQEDNYLKSDLPEKERDRLISFFRDYAYRAFLKVAEDNPPLNVQEDSHRP